METFESELEALIKKYEVKVEEKWDYNRDEEKSSMGLFFVNDEKGISVMISAL